MEFMTQISIQSKPGYLRLFGKVSKLCVYRLYYLVFVPFQKKKEQEIQEVEITSTFQC